MNDKVVNFEKVTLPTNNMQKLLSTFLIYLLLAFATHAQKLTYSNLYDQIEYCFSDYDALALTNDVYTLEEGEKVPYVAIAIEDVDWFHLAIFHLDGNLYMVGSVSGTIIPPDPFINTSFERSGFWKYIHDDDGDLSFNSFFTLEEIRNKKKLSEVVTGRYEILIAELSDETYLEQAAVDLNAVKTCEAAIIKELHAIPDEFRNMLQPYEFCYCITKSIAEDSDLIYGALNPSSPEGKELMGMCFLDYCPTCPDEGVTFEMMFGILETENAQEKSKEGFVKACVREIDDLSDVSVSFSEMEEYCDCIYYEMLENGEQDKDLSDYVDPNSVLTIESAAECGHLLTGGEEITFWNAASGVNACAAEVRIPLIIINGGFYAKVQTQSESRYLLVDSGASEILINREWASELVQLGLINGGSLGVEYFVTADGSDMAVEKMVVKELNIGGCSYENFTVGVADEGGMLLGMGFLGLFDSWEIDRGEKVLILRR